MIPTVIICLVHLAIAFAQQGGYPQGNYQPQQYAPPSTPRPNVAPPIGFLHDQGIDGRYKFAYQTQDGQTRAENTGSDGAVRGQYTYTSPEGQQVKVSYTADKNGFHADSDHIPRAGGAPPAAPQQYAPSPQQYSPPPQQQYVPQPQQYAPPPQHLSNPPSYPQQSYDYQQQQAGPSYSGAPVAQYAYGDPKVVSGLQGLFGK